MKNFAQAIGSFESEVRKLRCLNAILLSTFEQKSLEDILHSFINLLPSGFSYPEILCVGITLDNNKFTSKSFKKTGWSAAEPVRLGKKKIGLVEVYYISKSLFDDKSPFNAEELELLENIAQLLSNVYVNKMAEKDLERLAEERGIRLGEAESFTSDLLKYAGYPYLVIKPDTTIEYVNPAFEKLTGFTSAELVGQQAPYPFWPEGMDNIIMEEMLEEMKREVKREEEKFQKKSGEFFWVERTSRPVLNRGKIQNYLINWVDITERKKSKESILKYSEKLISSNRELEAFSYSVSHDLRSPLRAIRGYSQILKEDYSRVLDDEGMRILGVVQDEAARMSTLIDNILSLSRLGRKKMQREQIHTENLVNTIIRELKTAFTDYKPEITVINLHDLRGDRELIRTVFENLISNAIKYTRDIENPEIIIGSETRDGETIYYVKDNGIGFDMKYKKMLFQVFQRLHGTEDFEGTGVGLANVKRCIERHDGRVWAESEVGKGASFYFVIPEGGTDD